MARCLTCNYPLPDDRTRLGARCPNCHDPLYEPASRVTRPAREEDPSCAIHVGLESVGVCLRCGNYVCETCRTPWWGRILCPSCVSKALLTNESIPGQTRELTQQARISIFCAAFAWGLAVVAIVALYTLGARPGRVGLVATFLSFITLAVNVLLATVGTGHALAALRGEGEHRWLALGGLIGSSLYVALVMGMAALNLWQQ